MNERARRESLAMLKKFTKRRGVPERERTPLQRMLEEERHLWITHDLYRALRVPLEGDVLQRDDVQLFNRFRAWTCLDLYRARVLLSMNRDFRGARPSPFDRYVFDEGEPPSHGDPWISAWSLPSDTAVIDEIIAMVEPGNDEARVVLAELRSFVAERHR